MRQTQTRGRKGRVGGSGIRRATTAATVRLAGAARLRRCYAMAQDREMFLVFSPAGFELCAAKQHQHGCPCSACEDPPAFAPAQTSRSATSPANKPVHPPALPASLPPTAIHSIQQSSRPPPGPALRINPAPIVLHSCATSSLVRLATAQASTRASQSTRPRFAVAQH